MILLNAFKNLMQSEGLIMTATLFKKVFLTSIKFIFEHEFLGISLKNTSLAVPFTGIIGEFNQNFPWSASSYLNF